MSTNTTTSLSSQYQRYFQKQLLDHAIHSLQLNQFAMPGEISKNIGSKTARYFRPVTAASANVQTLTEGTPIATFTDLTYEQVDVDLIQIGEAMKFTDVLGWTSLFNVLKDGITLMGEDCALKGDDMTLSAICAGTSTARYSGGAASFAALAALSAGSAIFAAKDGLDACTNLVINKAPRINGEYVGIVPPQIARDIQLDPLWVDVSKYAASTQIFKGEIGKLHGIRYLVTTNAWTESSTKGTRDVAGGIYSSIFTGRNAYGTCKLSGSSQWKPQIIIADKPDKSDPLNQLLIAGWKAFYNAVLLNGAWCVVVRSKTLYS